MRERRGIDQLKIYSQKSPTKRNKASLPSLSQKKKEAKAKERRIACHHIHTYKGGGSLHARTVLKRGKAVNARLLSSPVYTITYQHITAHAARVHKL